MKIFIGQAVTGEDKEILKKDCSKIQAVLSEKGYNSYCTVHPKENLHEKTHKEIMQHAFDEIDDSDIFLAIIRSEKRSEGLLMEMGYVLSKNKDLIVAIKEGVVNTYVPNLANKVIKFKDIDDLCNKLKTI